MTLLQIHITIHKEWETAQSGGEYIAPSLKPEAYT
jgi:uncharacterized protein (DUF952 family)